MSTRGVDALASRKKMLLRALKDLAKHSSQTPWACAMITLLFSARDASLEAAAAGLACVPDAIAVPIRERYREILTQALAWLPGDVPPPRKHTGGWTNAERDAWNLATRMRRHEDQVLRLRGPGVDVAVQPVLAEEA